MSRQSDRPAVHSCERVTLTRLVVAEGAGRDNDPVREITYWYDDHGICVARMDPCALIDDEELLNA